MIAEDEYEIAQAYRLVLEARKHEVILTSDGQECADSYKDRFSSITPNGSNSPFDLVILDFRMPKKDALEVAEEIFAMSPAQRIIIASALAMESLSESLKRLDRLVEVIQKPFDLSTLVEAVESHEHAKDLKVQARRKALWLDEKEKEGLV